jgi:hypothetical protein
MVVCGAPRGNTSIVAYSLYNLGYFLGERIGELNYEDRDVLRLLPPPKFKSQFSESNFREFVAARNLKYARWGFKLPRASGYVPELAAMLRNPLFVVCFRNAIGTIRSISNRESAKVPIARMLTVAAQPVTAALNVIEHTDAPAILVDTDEVVATPGVFLQEISRTLGLHGDLGVIRDAIAKRGYKPSMPRDGVTFCPADDRDRASRGRGPTDARGHDPGADQRQHRHLAGDGSAGEGLSADLSDTGEHLDPTPPAA